MLVLAAVLPAPACLVPPEINPPPPQQDALEVLLVTAKPPPPIVNIPNNLDGGISSACRQDFEIVIDCQLKALLYYYWYLDFDKWKSDINSGVLEAPSGGSSRRAVPPFELVWQSYSEHALPGSYHTLELIISSSQFNRSVSMPPENTYGYFAWTVRVEDQCLND
jgi:hypothetical protein